MYVLKAAPEDFIVDEIPLVQESGSGEFCYYLMKKRGLTTQEAVSRVARALGRKESDIGFAGTKDRNAITTQLISVRRAKNDFYMRDRNLSVSYYGRGDSQLRLGDLIGNRFQIIVRNIERPPAQIPSFVNLFGEQRFSRNNHVIGELIVRKRFDQAVEEMIKGNGRWESAVREAITRRPTDPIAAIRQIPRPISLMFVHAYQSALWNLYATEIAKKGERDLLLPLIGFGTDMTSLPTEARTILEKEGITPRDFIIRQIPGFTFEGSERRLYADIHDLVIGSEEADEHSGAKKTALTFALNKGCYATVAIAAMLGYAAVLPALHRRSLSRPPDERSPGEDSIQG